MPQPGYPLPDGELGEDEIVCQLVYLPDRPEYWQAFLGALHYMTTWRAWERDDDKRGKDAASNWRAAFELTMECWRMTCLNDLQNNVAAILALMQQQDPCCNENITYYDSDTYITIIVPGDGDAPSHYGETAVSDWEEWREYLCHNANLWVDELIRAATTIETALSTGGITIGLIAAVMAAIAFFVVGGVLALPILMVIVFGLSAEVSSTIFEDAAVDIEEARDDIICAILSGRDVRSAVETALSSGIAWDTLFSELDYGSAIAILYEGGDGDTEYLEAELDDTCACLCLHAMAKQPQHNTVIYSSLAGAQMDMPRRTVEAGGTFHNMIAGSIQFNKEQEGDFCGPEKIIDSISVNDSIEFHHFQTRDQNGDLINEWFDSSPACIYDIGILVDEQCAEIYFARKQISDGGCGTDDITITMTYHDV